MSPAEWITCILSVLAIGISIVSYRHATSVKRLDLRVEARKARASLINKIDDVEPLVNQANISRRQLMTDAGRSGSGIMKTWGEEIGRNLENLRGHKNNIVEDDSAYLKMSDRQLEEEIVKLHGISVAVHSIEAVYIGSLEEDARQRSISRDMASRPFSAPGRP